MLDNIKSIYFKKIIFSFLNEGSKLKIIKYNNSLKKLMNVNLINYKIFIGKITIYDSKENVEEYSIHSRKLIYKGEYLNGKRN